MLYAHAGFYGRCVSRGLGVERPYVQLEAWGRLAQWNKCQKGEREGGKEKGHVYITFTTVFCCNCSI